MYIELKDRDMTPLVAIHLNDTLAVKTYNKLYVSYLPYNFERYKAIFDFKTLDDVTPNLSKYIPEDNAVLFLSEGVDVDVHTYEPYEVFFPKHQCCIYKKHINQLCFFRKKELRKYKTYEADCWVSEKTIQTNYDNRCQNTCDSKNSNVPDIFKNPINKLTIFLPHGTQYELQKANEVAKELMEKYGVEEVNVFALHCFQYINEPIFLFFPPFLNEEDCYINKIITTNSTGILPVRDTERLQVIDCKEIFEEYLKENN